jgi:hypothetical protein
MHWNLAFAVLPLISQWEYTRNATAAAQSLLPLLEGSTAWWACFLYNATQPDGSYVLHDVNARNPDAEHEGQVGDGEGGNGDGRLFGTPCGFLRV